MHTQTPAAVKKLNLLELSIKAEKLLFGEGETENQSLTKEGQPKQAFAIYNEIANLTEEQLSSPPYHYSYLNIKESPSPITIQIKAILTLAHLLNPEISGAYDYPNTNWITAITYYAKVLEKSKKNPKPYADEIRAAYDNLTLLKNKQFKENQEKLEAFAKSYLPLTSSAENWLNKNTADLDGKKKQSLSEFFKRIDSYIKIKEEIVRVIYLEDTLGILQGLSAKITNKINNLQVTRALNHTLSGSQQDNNLALFVKLSHVINQALEYQAKGDVFSIFSAKKNGLSLNEKEENLLNLAKDFTNFLAMGETLAAEASAILDSVTDQDKLDVTIRRILLVMSSNLTATPFTEWLGKIENWDFFDSEETCNEFNEIKKIMTVTKDYGICLPVGIYLPMKQAINFSSDIKNIEQWQDQLTIIRTTREMLTAYATRALTDDSIDKDEVTTYFFQSIIDNEIVASDFLLELFKKSTAQQKHCIQLLDSTNTDALFALAQQFRARIYNFNQEFSIHNLINKIGDLKKDDSALRLKLAEFLYDLSMKDSKESNNYLISAIFHFDFALMKCGDQPEVLQKILNYLVEAYGKDEKIDKRIVSNILVDMQLPQIKYNSDAISNICEHPLSKKISDSALPLLSWLRTLYTACVYLEEEKIMQPLFPQEDKLYPYLQKLVENNLLPASSENLIKQWNTIYNFHYDVNNQSIRATILNISINAGSPSPELLALQKNITIRIGREIAEELLCAPEAWKRLGINNDALGGIPQCITDMAAELNNKLAEAKKDLNIPFAQIWDSIKTMAQTKRDLLKNKETQTYQEVIEFLDYILKADENFSCLEKLILLRNKMLSPKLDNTKKQGIWSSALFKNPLARSNSSDSSANGHAASASASSSSSSSSSSSASTAILSSPSSPFILTNSYKT